MQTGLGSPHSSDPPSSSADPNLTQLRGQIKKVMIPLLIKIFELKLSAQQAKSPPSRLQKMHSEPIPEIISQLHSLQSDLQVLHLWCVSCQKQIERALKEVESPEQQPPVRYSSPSQESKESSSNWFQKFLGKP